MTLSIAVASVLAAVYYKSTTPQPRRLCCRHVDMFDT